MERIAQFEKVSFGQFMKDWLDNNPGDDEGEIRKIYDDIKLPRRATGGSAGYDFFAPRGFSLRPGGSIKVITGIRARIDEGWVLMVFPRSGLGYKYRVQLDNTVGVIDSDYYGAENEGHIQIKLTNDGKDGKTARIEGGSGFAQGVFLRYGITADDDAKGVRTGGFGSTTAGKERQGRPKGFLPALVLAAALSISLTLGGCGVSKARLEARDNGIALLESGDYEGAIAQFEDLISSADRVTDFELDVLKYRAEAEYKADDYAAAAHTYDILSQVDEERPEYDYIWAACLAMSADTGGAAQKIAAGRALDQPGEAPGYDEAMEALANAYAAQGDVPSQEAVYQELLSLGHGVAKNYNRLAVLAMGAGDYEKALDLIAAGLSGPGTAEGEDRRCLKLNEAICYEYLHDYGNALRLFEEYVDEFGEDGKALHEIAFLRTR